jgi:hypothetical protein
MRDSGANTRLSTEVMMMHGRGQGAVAGAGHAAAGFFQRVMFCNPFHRRNQNTRIRMGSIARARLDPRVAAVSAIA